MSNFDWVEGYRERINEGKTIAILWDIDDVIMSAKDMDVELTEEQAIDILGEVDHRHDANIGVNWEFIRCLIDMRSDD